MRMMAQNGIAHIIKMRHLAVAEQQRVFQFTRIADHAAVADDDVGANVRAVPDLAIRANDRRADYSCARLHHRAFAEKHVFANHRLGRNSGVIGRLQMGGKVIADARQCRPRRAVAFKEGGVLGLAEVK